MQNTLEYLSKYFNCSQTNVLKILIEEINSSPNGYFPNILKDKGCIHIFDSRYHNQPAIVEGEFEIVEDKIKSSCYLITDNQEVD